MPRGRKPVNTFDAEQNSFAARMGDDPIVIPPQAPAEIDVLTVPPPPEVPVAEPTNGNGHSVPMVNRTVTTTDRVQVPARTVQTGGMSYPSTTKQLVDWVAQNGAENFRVGVQRTKPFVSIIPDVPQGPWDAVVAKCQEFGEGIYDVTVYVRPKNGNGSERYALPVKATERVQVTAQFGPSLDEYKNISPNAPGATRGRFGADPEIDATTREVVKTRQERELFKAKVELEEEKESVEHRRAEKAHKATQGPNDAMARLVEDLRRSNEQMMLKLAELANKPHEKSDFPAIIAALAPILAVMLKPKEPEIGIKEILALVNADKKGDREHETSMLKMLMEQKLNPPNPLNQFREFREMMDEFDGGRDRGGDDVQVDPNNILGSLLAMGINAVRELAKNPAMGAVVERALNKPAAQATQEDIDRAQRQLGMQRKPALALPPLDNAPPVVPPVRPQRPPQKMPPPVEIGVVPVPQVTPLAPHSSPSPTGPATPPKKESFLDSVPLPMPAAEPPPAIVTPPAPPVIPPQPADVEEIDDIEASRRGWVTNAIMEAVVDIMEERSAIRHNWIDMAVGNGDPDDTGNWGKPFQREIAACVEPMAAIALIKSKCDPEVWKKFETAKASKEMADYQFLLAVNTILIPQCRKNVGQTVSESEPAATV